jgi:hypothetical protein
MDREKVIRIIIGLLSFAWATYHVFVGYNSATFAASVTGKASFVFAEYSEYFGFAAALYIFAGYEIINGTRRLIPLIYLLYVVNLLLAAIAYGVRGPLLGQPLPFNLIVAPALVLDMSLVALTALLWMRSYVGVR